jgi:hypothetical protein
MRVCVCVCTVSDDVEKKENARVFHQNTLVSDSTELVP